MPKPGHPKLPPPWGAVLNIPNPLRRLSPMGARSHSYPKYRDEFARDITNEHSPYAMLPRKYGPRNHGPDAIQAIAQEQRRRRSIEQAGLPSGVPEPTNIPPVDMPRYAGSPEVSGYGVPNLPRRPRGGTPPAEVQAWNRRMRDPARASRGAVNEPDPEALKAQVAATWYGDPILGRGF